MSAPPDASLPFRSRRLPSLRFQLGLSFGLTSVLLAVLPSLVAGAVGEAAVVRDQRAALAQHAVHLRDLLDRDITSRVAAEEVLRRSHSRLETLVAERTAVLSAALGEKETLVKEIRHRVKNNPQVVSSLLWFQTRKLTDPPGAAVLRESQQRVETMTVFHEPLYRAGDLARIEAPTSLSELSRQRFTLVGAGPGRVALTVQAQEILELEHAAPCGRILTEALSNSIKYTFTDDRTGAITIALERVASDRLRLLAADDGVGLPPGLPLAGARSLGMRLIQNLTRQLRGTLSITGDPGCAPP